MDFLTTLLAYMAASLVIAVESTATPSVTPVPTPAPTPEPESAAAVETVTGFPSVEEAFTPAPTATVSVTPEPVPTITPNTAAYHNLSMGDRGAEVTRLQEKLIELGYLPEGAADGAYGGQTRTAVRRFQYYNGLTVDGVAGRATQTNLFENPEARPYPEQETPTPEAAPETPAPEDAGETAEPADTPEPAEPTVTPVVVATPAATEQAETAAPETAAPEPDAPEATPDAPEESAEPEETPAEETPGPTEVVENVDLDEAEASPTPVPTEKATPIPYADLAGWIVLNDSGESMQWTALEDGVPVVRPARMQSYEGDIRISLDDVSQCVESWTLTDEGDSLILEAQGFTLALLNEDAGFVSTVDGIEMVTEPGDFDFSEGHFIRADFLTRALDGTWDWDEEEQTLMLRIPEKEDAGYTD